jgi:hypothetical protein
VIFLAIVVAFLSSAFPAQKGLPVMHGMVVDVEDHPIVGATVSLSRLPSAMPVGTTTTGSDGEFSLEGVTPDIYRLTAESVDSQLSAWMPVVFTGEYDSREMKLVMRGAGIVSGRVLDENDEAISGARVEVLRLPSDPMPIAAPTSGAILADATGKYRLVGMPPGQYLVRADVHFQKGRTQYPVTYYPGVTDADAAALLTVPAANEISNIDIRLAPVGVRVRGRIIGEVAKPPQFALIPRTSSEINTPLPTIATGDGKNAFEVLGVAPGAYYLYYFVNINPLSTVSPQANNPLTSESKVRWARTAINVGAEDLENVTIVIAPPGRIQGRIAIAPDSTEPDTLDFSTIKLSIGYAESIPPFGSPPPRVSPELDERGQFELPHVPEGLLRIQELDLPDGWFLSEIRQDGQDVSSSSLSIAAGQNFSAEVVISNRGGTLVGTVLDPDKNPLPSSRYVLLPEDPWRRSNPLFMKSGSSYEKGGFHIESLSPGEYMLIAFPDTDRFSTTFVRSLKNVEKYTAFGQHVHIDAGRTTQVSITVVPEFERWELKHD